MTTLIFHVTGTHCAACKIFIEDSLNELNFVKKVNVNLKNKLIQVDVNTDKLPQELAEILTEKIKQNGYQVTVNKSDKSQVKNEDMLIALPIGLAVLLGFFLLQKSGILNIGIGELATPATSFLIGLVASVSSCLAVVGGLVLSLSSKISQDNKSDTQTFIAFHLSRIISFTLLGGLLGAIGGAITLNYTISAMLGLFASVIMLLLGLNLVGLLTTSKSIVPASIFNSLRRIEHKALTPVILGIATFFLPCGFTQSIQVSALSSASFSSGSLIMLSFSLGTFPVLALLSFGTASFAHSKYSPVFFKSVGVVVVGLGVFSLLSALAGLGIVSPVFNI